MVQDTSGRLCEKTRGGAFSLCHVACGGKPFSASGSVQRPMFHPASCPTIIQMSSDCRLRKALAMEVASRSEAKTPKIAVTVLFDKLGSFLLNKVNIDPRKAMEST